MLRRKALCSLFILMNIGNPDHPSPRPARDRRSRRVPRSWRFRLYTIEYQDCDRFLRPLVDEEAPQKNRLVGARESLPGAISTAGELVRSGPRDGNGRDTGSVERPAEAATPDSAAICEATQVS